MLRLIGKSNQKSPEGRRKEAFLGLACGRQKYPLVKWRNPSVLMYFSHFEFLCGIKPFVYQTKIRKLVSKNFRSLSLALKLLEFGKLLRLKV